MREGKYVSALDQYDAAARVAPGNQMITLGRGIDELGAGYYRNADLHLRGAMVSDPALMMAQVNLKSLLPKDRLESLVKDLKEIARKQEKDATSPFLLAFMAYNTGNASQAGVYLDLAEKRSGGRDPFYKLIRMHWGLE